MKRKKFFSIMFATMLSTSAILQAQDTTTVTPLGLAKDAFKGCTKLVEITLPANTQIVGDNAFAACPLLAKVVLAPGKLSTLTDTPFPDQDGLKIYVTDAAEKDKLDQKYGFTKTVVLVAEPTAVEQINTNTDFRIALSNGKVSVTLDKKAVNIGVYNMNGMCIAQQCASKGQTTTFNLAQGVYAVRIGQKSIRVLIK